MAPALYIYIYQPLKICSVEWDSVKRSNCLKPKNEEWGHETKTHIVSELKSSCPVEGPACYLKNFNYRCITLCEAAWTRLLQNTVWHIFGFLNHEFVCVNSQSWKMPSVPEREFSCIYFSVDISASGRRVKNYEFTPPYCPTVSKNNFSILIFYSQIHLPGILLSTPLP